MECIQNVILEYKVHRICSCLTPPVDREKYSTVMQNRRGGTKHLIFFSFSFRIYAGSRLQQYTFIPVQYILFLVPRSLLTILSIFPQN